jgi:hypothetical protein
MIKVYLDMDGVIADFRKAWFALSKELGSLSLREATLDHKIYRGLELLPNAPRLIEELRKAEEARLCRIQLLTSAHTFKVDQYYECRDQKQAWLNEHGLGDWPMILTNCGEEKACWASNRECFLIDDTAHNCSFFQEEGGSILHYNDVDCENNMRVLAAMFFRL